MRGEGGRGALSERRCGWQAGMRVLGGCMGVGGQGKEGERGREVWEGGRDREGREGGRKSERERE